MDGRFNGRPKWRNDLTSVFLASNELKLELPSSTRAFAPTRADNRHQDDNLLSSLEAPSMSRASKLTLLGTSIGAIAIVIGVHYQQVYDKGVRIL